MAQRHIPGMAVAVVNNGGVVLVQAFGLADNENNVPVTRRTVFRFTSVSKPITAVAAMQLAEANRLSLDATLPLLGELARLTKLHIKIEGTTISPRKNWFGRPLRNRFSGFPFQPEAV